MTDIHGERGVAQPILPAADLVGLLRGVWARKLLMIGIVGFAAASTVAFITLSERLYTADAQILVERSESSFTRPQTEAATAPQPRETDIASQVQIVLSRDVAERVIQTLDLASEETLIGEPRGFTGLPFIGGERRETPLGRRVLEAYYKGLRVFPVGDSKVVTIEFTARDAQLAARIADEVARTYVNYTREIQDEEMRQAREWLASQIEALRRTVVDSERAVEEFRVRAGLLEGRGTALSSEGLSELNTQIIAAGAQRAEAEARSQAIRDVLREQGSVDSFVDVVSSPLIQRLIERRIALEGQLADLSTIYLDSHPRMVSLREEVSNINQQIRMEATKIAEGLDQSAKIAGARENALRASLDELKASAGGDRLDEVKLRALEREAAANRNLLEAFLNRYSDASARDNELSQPPIARVISRAQVPLQPSFPRAGAVLALGLLAGIVLAIVIAFVSEVIRSAPAAPTVPVRAPRSGTASAEAGIQDGGDSAARFDGLLAKAGKVDFVGGESATVIAEIGRRLNAWFWEDGVRRILIADDGEGDVSGLLPLRFAHRAGQLGLKAIIIDLAPGARSLAVSRGLKSGQGLGELLAGEATFSDVIVHDEQSGVPILRGERTPDGPHLALDSERIDIVFDALSEAYDLILVNDTIADGLSPANRLAHGCAALILVTTERGSHGPRVPEFVRDFREGREKPVVIVRPGEQEGLTKELDAALAPRGFAA